MKTHRPLLGLRFSSLAGRLGRVSLGADGRVVFMARFPSLPGTPIPALPAPRGGPYKIVHHTTEAARLPGLGGIRAQQVVSALHGRRQHHLQHVDTQKGRVPCARSPGVQTNRDSAVQIELVGFAHVPRSRLAVEPGAPVPWIEATHSVPRVWRRAAAPRCVRGRDPRPQPQPPRRGTLKAATTATATCREHPLDPAYTAD